MNTDDRSGFLWWIFTGLAAIAGMINISNLIRKPREIRELEKVIQEQDKMIVAQQKIIKDLLKL